MDVSTGTGTWGSMVHPVMGSGVNTGGGTAEGSGVYSVAVTVESGGCPGGNVGVTAGMPVDDEAEVSVTQPPVSTMKTIAIKIAGYHAFLKIFSVMGHNPSCNTGTSVFPVIHVRKFCLLIIKYIDFLMECTFCKQSKFSPVHVRNYRTIDKRYAMTGSGPGRYAIVDCPRVSHGVGKGRTKGLRWSIQVSRM